MVDLTFVPKPCAGARLAARFAIADLVYDRFLTLISIVLLAALLAPPVVLHTIRVGLIETWAQDLARDLRNREVVIVGENQITGTDLADIAGWPETGFVVPEPSFFVATQRVRKAGARGMAVDLNLRTTAAGDPVMSGDGVAGLGRSEIVLSARAAQELEIARGDGLTIQLARTPSDAAPVRQSLELTVADVLPEGRWAGTEGFVSPDTLLGFREWLTFASDDPEAVPPGDGVVWQSLRIYAPTVAGAVVLRDRLDAAGYETRLMTDQVERILKLEIGLRQVFGLVTALSVVAFVITAFLLQWISVLRKKRDLALMSVIGMTPSDLAVFPVVQGALMTAVAALMALGMVALTRGPVEEIVQGYLATPAPVQSPDLLPLLLGLSAAVGIGALAGAGAVMTSRRADWSHALRGD